MTRTIILFNPAARGEKSARFRRRLAELGAGFELRPTTGPGSARGQAAQAVREGCQTLVAAGGDGTVNEVLNGIGDVPGGFGQTRLGVLPLGTANVFAREAGVPMALDRALEALQSGREARVDLPKARFETAGGTVERYFIQLGGAGFDARAVELVDWALKKKIGFLAYAVSCFQALREPRSIIECSAPGFEARGQMVLLGNGRCYGGPFKLFEKASVSDGRLDALVFPRASLGTAVRVAAGLAARRVQAWTGARAVQAERIELRSAGRAPLELDGEPAGWLPAVFSVEPGRVRVVSPRGRPEESDERLLQNRGL